MADQDRKKEAPRTQPSEASNDTLSADQENERAITRINALADIRSDTSTATDDQKKELFVACIADCLNVLLVQKKLSEPV